MLKQWDNKKIVWCCSLFLWILYEKFVFFKHLFISKVGGRERERERGEGEEELRFKPKASNMGCGHPKQGHSHGSRC